MKDAMWTYQIIFDEGLNLHIVYDHDGNLIGYTDTVQQGRVIAKIQFNGY